MTPEEINKQSAVMEAITRDLERAGLLGKGINRTELMKALLDPNVTTPEEKQFHDLQEIGDPDKRHVALPENSAVFGEDANTIRAKMDSEFIGRGWSPEDLATLPKHPMSDYVEGGIKRSRPEPKQLSPGGRQADEYRRRRDLIQGITNPTTAQKVGRYIPDGLLSDGKDTMFSLDRNFDDPVKAFENERNRKYGTSGFQGAMENPEYNFGWYNNNAATPVADTIQYVQHEGEEIVPAMGRANERRQALAMSKAVDPVLPNVPGETYDRASREKLLAGLRPVADNMRPKTHDMSFREKHGYYPGYAGSMATDFAQNIPEAATLFTGGVGIKAGIKAFMKSLGKEMLTEDLPAWLGIVGGSHLSADKNAAKTPAWKDWNASRGVDLVGSKFGKDSSEYKDAVNQSNNARTDLYRQDDSTGKWRPETEDEFTQSVKDQVQTQMSAEGQFQKLKKQMPGY